VPDVTGTRHRRARCHASEALGRDARPRCKRRRRACTVRPMADRLPSNLFRQKSVAEDDDRRGDGIASSSGRKKRDPPPAAAPSVVK
jgi:hypothetical protein